MSTAKGPGERKIPQHSFEDDADLWEYYNPALALVDGRDRADALSDEESASAREVDQQHGGFRDRDC